ncbi:hypothetical protein [Cellulomonas sp. URHE0023]|uniref:hypothetical protein n=1 Tax=Cellulomonas sp. URHE0023 TaxID=1380354 RepID=UPI000B07C3D4|nr:hypothetical protein [Cellulomonas sp. URHE0023]
MSGVVDPDSQIGRWLARDRPFVDALLRSAAAQDGDPIVLRAAIVEVAAAVRTEPGTELVPELGRALLQRVVDVVVRGRWHADDPERSVLLSVIPRLGGLLTDQPGATVDAVCAAARTVARSGDPALFADLLAAVPPTGADEDGVRAVVLVATWRSGAARYRAAALAAAATLPDVAARAVLRLPDGTDVAGVLRRHAADPWWWPQRPVEPGVVRRIGGFRGFGGPWLARPRVVPGGPTGCAVTADGCGWAVVADVHGAAVVRLDEPIDIASARTQDVLPVPWTDRVTGSAPLGTGVLAVSRRHSYLLDVVRVAS